MKNDKQILKQFNSWRKDKTFIFKDDFYTQLVNTNNDVKLDKWTVEILLYAITEGIETFDLQLFDIKTTSAKKPVKVLKHIFKSFGLERPFEKYWDFLEQYLNYREKGQMTNEEQFDLMNVYWVWVNDLFDLNSPEFNKWIILSNRYIYKKQKGFNLK